MNISNVIQKTLDSFDDAGKPKISTVSVRLQPKYGHLLNAFKIGDFQPKHAFKAALSKRLFEYVLTLTNDEIKQLTDEAIDKLNHREITKTDALQLLNDCSLCNTPTLELLFLTDNPKVNK
jgi:hypothetical protein